MIAKKKMFKSFRELFAPVIRAETQILQYNPSFVGKQYFKQIEEGAQTSINIYNSIYYYVVRMYVRTYVYSTLYCINFNFLLQLNVKIEFLITACNYIFLSAIMKKKKTFKPANSTTVCQ